MKILIYDSAYYSAEHDYEGRYVIWAIESGTGIPVCLNVVGYHAEAWLELPVTARGHKIDWSCEIVDPEVRRDLGLCDPTISRLLRKKVEGILAMGVGSDPRGSVTYERRFKMIGYRETRSHYFHVKCEKREALDDAIKSTKISLKDEFSGAEPVWRETEIDAVTKMFVCSGWDRSGWLEIPDDSAYERIKEPPTEVNCSKITRPLCWIDERSKVRPVKHLYLDWTSIATVPESARPLASSASPVGLYFDFEALSGKLHGFPKELSPSDPVYMASVVCATLGSDKSTWRKYCVVLGEPDVSRLAGVKVVSVTSEEDLYMQFGQIFIDENPDFISGYNIHGFDLKYMETRLATWGLKFPNISRLPGKVSEFDFLRGPRGARYTNIKCPGRIVVDLFLYLTKNVSRQELQSFSLKNVTKFYMKDEPQKIELGYIEQFRLYFRYLIGAPDGPEGLGKIAEYCVRDSEVLPRLFDICGVWKTSIQFSNVLGSTIQTIAVAGLVEKLCPFLFKNVRDSETVMEINPDVGNVHFEGGHVQLTTKGLHRNVTIGDFSSLYPSLMISLNLCWSTRVPENDTLRVMNQYGDDGYRITDLKYQVKETRPPAQLPEAESEYGDSDDNNDIGRDPDDSGSESDISDAEGEVEAEKQIESSKVESAIRKAKIAMTPKENFTDRQVKIMYVSSKIKLGIIPKALIKLLAERKHIRKVIIPALKKDLKLAISSGDTSAINALSQAIDDADKRQNVTKLCANSIYGIMGANAPYADPFVGMTTTTEGRLAINKTTDVILSADGARSHIYTDTDSSMVKDPSFAMFNTDILLNEITLRIEDLGIDPATLPKWTLDGHTSYSEMLGEMVEELREIRRKCAIPSIMAELDKLIANGGFHINLDLPRWVLESKLGYRDILKQWAAERTLIERSCVIPMIEQKAKGICDLVNKYRDDANKPLFGSPMSFEYEAFVVCGLFLAKKFYAAVIIDEEGKIKIKQRGVPLRRGDYPAIVKKIYGDVLFGLLRGKGVYAVMRMLVDHVRRILLGADFTFEECAISSDFKSITDYKQPTCKMAILAKCAAEAGVPLQNNTRIDYVMLAPPNQQCGMDSILTSTKSNSTLLSTREMISVGAGIIDRDHYFKVLISHIDKMMGCVIEQVFIYVLVPEIAINYVFPGFILDRNVSLKELAVPLRIRRHSCQNVIPEHFTSAGKLILPAKCDKLMTVHVGGTGEGGLHHEMAGILPISHCCIKCAKAAPKGSVPLVSMSYSEWDMSQPMTSFKNIYQAILRTCPQQQLKIIRERAMNFFSYVIESEYKHIS
jgi:DNA polymerase delta subunit 1